MRKAKPVETVDVLRHATVYHALADEQHGMATRVHAQQFAPAQTQSVQQRSAGTTGSTPSTVVQTDVARTTSNVTTAANTQITRVSSPAAANLSSPLVRTTSVSTPMSDDADHDDQGTRSVNATAAIHDGTSTNAGTPSMSPARFVRTVTAGHRHHRQTNKTRRSRSRVGAFVTSTGGDEPGAITVQEPAKPRRGKIRRGLGRIGGYGGRTVLGVTNRTSSQYAADGHDENDVERWTQTRTFNGMRRAGGRSMRAGGRVAAKSARYGYRGVRRMARSARRSAGRFGHAATGMVRHAATVASSAARMAVTATIHAVSSAMAAASVGLSAPLLAVIIGAVVTVAAIFSLFLGASSSQGACTTGKTAAYLAWARTIADDDTHGYSQPHRDGPDYDCSSLVYYALKAAGYSVPDSAWNTTSAETALQALGFTRLDYAPDLVEEGDIVWSASHMEFYAGSGEYIGARLDEDGGIEGLQTGDQTGEEIAVYTGAPDGMTTIWRPAATGSDCSSSVGTTVGSLTPKLVMKTDSIADMAATGTVSDTRYPYGQCTWWAASRREQIGRPIPGWGNAKDWSTQATASGFAVDAQARVGDVIVFQPGTLGADGTYGHVAVVERIDEDGSMLISESNVIAPGVISIRTFTKAQLDAASSGISFVH